MVHTSLFTFLSACSLSQEGMALVILLPALPCSHPNPNSLPHTLTHPSEPVCLFSQKPTLRPFSDCRSSVTSGHSRAALIIYGQTTVEFGPQKEYLVLPAEILE